MMSTPQNPDAPSGRKLILATLVAMVIAGLVLVTVVLPAEYGIDPLGTGEPLGLVVLTDAGNIPVRTDGIVSSSRSYRVDEKTFELGPGEEVEYKFRLAADGNQLGPVRDAQRGRRGARGSG
jgi:hypothetical protein